MFAASLAKGKKIVLSNKSYHLKVKAMILTAGCQNKDGSISLRAKTWMIMKLTIAFLLFFTFQVSANGYAQKITIVKKNASLTEIFKAIERQTGFLFFYDKAVIQKAEPVDIAIKDATLDQALSACLKGQELTYSIVKNTVVIRPEKKTYFQAQAILTPMEAPEPPPVEIHGRVVNQQGEPLQNVSVLIAGTQIGTTTNADGRFSLTAPDDRNVVLEVSSVGYQTKKVNIGKLTEVNVVLELEVSGLSDVVVVGYGTQKKATLSGAISTVDGADLLKSKVTNVGNSLAGRLAGVTAVTSRGEPGKDGTTIRIRGSNSLGDNNPLIVVDGVPGRSLERIDPNDIESMTILKDASAAIYGSQAANGVILIVTKRGKTGKPKLELNLDHGFSQPTRIPKLTNSAEYATTLNEIDVYKNRVPRYSQEEIQKFADGSDPWKYPNTDWIDATFKKWSEQTFANANLRGGNESLKYFVSLGAKNQGTNYKNSNDDYNQYDFRSNLDGKINKSISLQFDIAGRMEDRNFPTGTAQLINITDLYSVVLRQKPNMQAYWPNGLPGPDYTDGFNPVVMATDQPGYQNQKDYAFNSNLKLSIKIPWINGLSIDGNAAIDYGFGHDKRFTQPWYLYTWDNATYDANNIPVLVKTSRGVSDANLVEVMSNSNNVLLNGLIRYENTISKDHNINLLAGVEKITGRSHNIGAFRRYFVSTAIDELNLGGTRDMTNNGTSDQTARLNYFGRFNYNYQEKYLVELIGRIDGTYIFPARGRFGFFPGISLAWRPSEELFWKNINFATNVKIRASYGQTGNDRIDPYQYLTTYSFAARNQNQVFDVNQEYNSLYATRIPNENITWEVATQRNVGLDASFLNGRLSFTFDYFDYLRTNILWQRLASVPTSTGLVLPRENIGKVANKGFDFEITFADQIKDLNYRVWLTGGHQKNKIIFWDESPGAPKYQQSTGHPMNSELYYKGIGIFRDQAAIDAYPHWSGARPGDVIFEDVNNDGKIDANDRVRDYRSNIPTFQGGVGLSLTYKQFDLLMFFQGAAGADVNTSIKTAGDFGNGLKSDFDGRWTPENIDAVKPRASDAQGEYWRSQNNTFFLHNTDYIRLKNLELGYNTSKKINKLLGIEGIRAYASGFNLFTFTSLPDFDPESAGGSIGYPVQRIISLGLSLTF
jgi:TonB-linked SusC/RagA family outer membrane protein